MASNESISSQTNDGAISFLGNDEDNLYAQAVDVGHRIDPRAQKIFVIVVVMAVVFAVGLVVPKDMLNSFLHMQGKTGYTFAWFVEDLQGNLARLAAVFAGQDSVEASRAVTEIVRNIVVMLAGAGLALSGAVYQGAFRNALVSPSTLGVMSGASIGLVIWVVLYADGSEGIDALRYGLAGGNADFADYLLSTGGAAILSFAGCMLVVGLVLLTLRLAGGGASGIMLIITGQVIGGIIGAVNTTIRYYYLATDPWGTAAAMLQNLQIASFWRVFTWIDVIALGIPLVVTFACIMRIRQKMMLLSLDATEARSMGVDAKRMQYEVVALCTLLTAIIVSFCGSIGFVGFLVPHLARRLVGPNFKFLLPASMALGALFVMSAFLLVSMTLGPSYETMTGMFISIGGAAVFLVTALRGGGRFYGGFK